MEEHEDEVGKAVNAADQAGRALAQEAEHFWAADNQDLMAELNLLPSQ